ncbi:MAG: hypothetical protein ACI9LT_001457 [Pseudoalteromonas distincta]|jgi:hypothetical protein
MIARGEVSAGVILQPNGQLMTGQTVAPELSGLMPMVADPKIQVLFRNNLSGLGVVRVVTWAELETGGILHGDARDQARKSQTHTDEP